MNGVVGEMRVTFSGDVEKDKMMEEFSEFFVISGKMELFNHKGETVVLDIQEIEDINFDEF